MLDDFVVAHREEIIDRCRGKVALRSNPPSTPAEIDHGPPMFLDQLVAELRIGLSPDSAIIDTAAQHGHDLLVQGLTPSQVVHDYGDICQAITEMALEEGADISTGDFQILNQCLDDAIASAITQYGHEQDAWAGRSDPQAGASTDVLWYGLGLAITSASIGFQAIRDGRVGVTGSTAALLEKSLDAAETLYQQMLAELEIERGRRNRKP